MSAVDAGRDFGELIGGTALGDSPSTNCENARADLEAL